MLLYTENKMKHEYKVLVLTQGDFLFQPGSQNEIIAYWAESLIQFAHDFELSLNETIVHYESLVSKFRKRLRSASVALSLLAWCVAVYAVEAFHDLATQSFEESATLLK